MTDGIEKSEPCPESGGGQAQQAHSSEAFRRLKRQVSRNSSAASPRP